MTNEALRDYILSMQDGERVVETGRSCLQGRQGTIYHNPSGDICIRWDKLPGEEGRMGTSFTGGARRVSEVARFDLSKFEKMAESVGCSIEQMRKDLLDPPKPATRKRSHLLRRLSTGGKPRA